MHYVDRRPTGRSILHRLFVVSLAIGFAGMMSGEAMAQAKKNPAKALEKRDTNGDGKVSRDEWKESAQFFAKVDANGDNSLTVEEFPVYFSVLEGSKTGKTNKNSIKNKRKKPASKGKSKKKIAKEKEPGKKLFSAVKSMDKSRDGKIGRDEWTGPKWQFDKVDANRDDVLTVEEIAISLIKDVDKDGNGVIGKSEWKRPKKEFNRIDQNGNNEMTKEEYAADLGWTRAGGRR